MWEHSRATRLLAMHHQTVDPGNVRVAYSIETSPSKRLTRKSKGRGPLRWCSPFVTRYGRTIAPSGRCKASSSCKSKQVLGTRGQENHARLLERFLTASIAAVCLCITKPALADLPGQGFPVRHGPHIFPYAWQMSCRKVASSEEVIRLCRSSGCIPRRQPGPTSTVTMDRAWLESLLLDEVGSR